MMSEMGVGDDALAFDFRRVQTDLAGVFRLPADIQTSPKPKCFQCLDKALAHSCE